MRKGAAQLHADDIVYFGIDLHRQRWHVTVRTAEIELLSASIPGTWEALHSLLEPYRGHHIEAASMRRCLATTDENGVASE